MKEILIKSPSYGDFLVLVDDEDFELVSKYNWQVLKRPNKATYARSRQKGKKRRTILMHRLILGILDDPNIVCDHINGNGLDNRRLNIRKASGLENARNYKTPSNNTTGYKGVCKKGAKFRAYLNYDRKQKAIGVYDTAEQAAFAYNVAARIRYGEFANLNRILAMDQEDFPV